MKIVSFIIAVLFYLPCFSQPVTHYYKTGDTVSNLQIRHVINFKKNSCRIADFKGKYVLIDFWSTGCSECILSWPKLLQLQEKFNDDLQIVLVNCWETIDKVQATFEKRKRLAGVDMRLPAACGDKKLLDHFAIEGIPHVLWINREGVIDYITNGLSVTEDHIYAVLKGQRPYMRHKGTQVFADGNVPQRSGRLIDETILSNGDLSLHPSFGIEYLHGRYNIMAVNQNIRDLYRIAYGDNKNYYGFYDKRPILATELIAADTTKYAANMDDHENLSDFYIYQYISTDSVGGDSLQRKMQIDLDRYFHIKVTKQKKLRKCLVLTALDTALMRYKEGEVAAGVNPYMFTVNKITPRDLVDIMRSNLPFDNRYILQDETGFNGYLGKMFFSADVLNVGSLNGQLEKYGLRLVETVREVEVLVLQASD